MSSNTENNSASESVKTLPRWKAYLGFIAWVKNNQRTVALFFGYVLVGTLSYGLGKYSIQNAPPDIRIEEPQLDISQLYNNLNGALPQITGSDFNGGIAGAKTLDCGGKIKGNISTSGKIYHLPGGAFYKRTNPEICFDTEDQAKAAGFRKSSR